MECRICFGDNSDQILISPCNCAGTLKFVHRECLDKWRKISRHDTFCDICKTKYKFIPETKTHLNTIPKSYLIQNNNDNKCGEVCIYALAFMCTIL